MKRTLLVAALALGGCATSDEQMRMAIAAQQNVKPTLKVTCPAGGCEVEYTDPRDKGNIKLPTNGWDAFNNVVSTTGAVLQGAVVPVAMGVMAVKGMEAMKGHGQTTTTNTTTSTSATSTQSTTQTLSGTGVLGTGTYSTTDSTHAPTVVVQPPPVVVTQPPPLVVNPVIVP